LLLASAPVTADGRAGEFDFYVLSLSWTPAACASGAARNEECDAPHGFLVHGFWPEYETGYPEDCPSDQPQRVPQSVLDTVDDVMPSTGLAGYEWRKHGICSGLSPAAYFALLGKAARKIVTPQLLTPGNVPSQTTPAKIEAAFGSANPGLTASGMAVRCTDNTLTEVRICLRKDLAFRPCSEIDAASCHARSISVAPFP
jgi:ribonuclease T2